MTTEELIEELKKYPGMRVCVSDQWGDELEGADVSPAIDHPDQFIKRRSWHWEVEWKGEGPEPQGEKVVVIY